MLKFVQEDQLIPAMASSSHRRNDAAQYCKASDNPHFFKVVLANALKEQKLEIPKKFVKEHGLKAFLNNQTCLKVADGREWNVGLTKSNGRVWFHHGWQQFVEFYSIGFEYFLLFKYKGRSSTFRVVILDLTATEIEYPINKIRLHQDKEEKLKMETELDVFHHVFYPQDFKVGKVSLNTIEPMNAERKLPSTTSQQARAMAKASTFQSMTLNPSFMCKIWTSHIQGRSLNVPKSFVDVHLEEPATEFLLQVSDGRMWSICCGYYCTPRMQRKAELRTGWKKFTRDNNLHVGDACVFEMITKNTRTITFKVQIFRAS